MQKSNFHALIFDMDGVLVDSEIYWKKVESSFLQGLIPTWSESDQRSIIGLSAYDVHARLVGQYGVAISREDYVGYYEVLAQRIYGEQCSALNGALELIEKLMLRKIPLGLTSSSPRSWIDIVLDRFSLRSAFRAIVSSDDVGGQAKPRPDIYIRTAELLRLDPIKCVAIEDTAKGLQSATGAGMFCIGLRNGFNEHQDFARANLVLNGFVGEDVSAVLALFS